VRDVLGVGGDKSFCALVSYRTGGVVRYRGR